MTEEWLRNRRGTDMQACPLGSLPAGIKEEARMDRLRIAQAQMPVITDRDTLADYLKKTMETCTEKNAELLALPEMFCCPYDVKSFPVFAEPEGGSVWQLCSDLARSFHIWLSAGTIPERTADGRIYNTAYVFSPDGRQAAKHRKMHLFDIGVKGGQHFRESDILSAGDSVTVFSTEFGPVGLAVCFDIRFPELFRLMALKGARIVLVPAAFNLTTGPMHWELLFRSQAVNNQLFVVGTSSARDESASYVSWGHSIAADPWGRILSQADAGEELVFTELDLTEVEKVREQIPVMNSLRTDVYQVREESDL